PVVSVISNKSVEEEAELIFSATASDADLPAQTLTFSLNDEAVAKGMSINNETGAFSWMPTESQDGSHEVTVTGTDGELTDSETITITVIEVNSAPTLAGIGNKSVEEGVELTFMVAASDADLPVQTLTFSIDEAAIATGMAINGETGAFSWMPTESQDGSHEVTVTVSDGELTDSETITITVIEVNSAPVLSAIGNKSVEEGAVLTFTATTTDADVPSQTLSYSLDDLAVANGMTVGASSGEFSWAPVAGQAGAYEVTLSVNDGVGSDSETFTVTATGATVEENHPPVVFEAVVDRSLTEGFASLEVNLTAVFTDEDDDNLAVLAESSDESVAMVSVSEQTLIISEAGIGQATVTVTADDGRGGSVSDSFDLEVVSANISGVQGEATLTMATYPNPTDGRLQVSLEGSFKGVLTAGIRNVSGLLFLETTVKGNSGKITTQLDLVGLDPGVYLLNISLDGKPVATRRIIKK
ncbi:MAG: putative Ig domain-containing protein, partial [Imperialibacter sp.]